MRLAAARARLVTLRFARPVQTARGTFATRSSVILELCDTDGRRGYGEAAPFPAESAGATPQKQPERG